MKKKKNIRFCPNSDALKGSLVLGYVENEKVEYFNEKVYVDKNLKAIIKNKENEVRKYIRFTHPCMKSSCKHWNNKCQIPESFSSLNNKGDELNTLKKCVIQDECQWFSQRSYQACANCQYILNYTKDITI
ncbi:hypothetical protein [Polaribacter cellanae]|uniref:Uncharacterized protein n=1 Tax=Polaribacter cellanae TaxID=2818493 RepID=A0A975H6J7_9FLAO|nr:hypothetical protein [Polaribacter cellanae]QTE21989.1 hypothetical protein J3359_14390 [Polaribacter cellanae]